MMTSSWKFTSEIGGWVWIDDEGAHVIVMVPFFMRGDHNMGTMTNDDERGGGGERGG